jgi:hypothetical protein
MAQTYDVITDELRAFIEKQHVFFVGSAPLSGDGHVNVSPKGLDCFRVLSPTRAGYVDLTGSGNETSAHLHENGRVTFMFCAFVGKPMILRLFGRGRVVLPGSAGWGELAGVFPDYPGARQIIVAELDRVQTSCGFAVPLMEHAGDRDLLPKWARKKGAEGLAEYRRKKNARSIDGLEAPVAG